MTPDDSHPALSADERARYSRHLSLPEIGEAGQARLKQASVLLVGAGGLGAPAALYLAAAGVGRLGLVDLDAVELSNLQRQILYGVSSLGREKVEAARERLADLNPNVQVDTFSTPLRQDNAETLLGGYDLILDGSDNFATRFLVNDACVRLNKFHIHASVGRFTGQLTVLDPRNGPCYRCIFPVEPPAEAIPSCAEGGVLGVVPGILGSLQAAEALKLLLNIGEPLVGRLLIFDGLAGRFREHKVAKDPHCVACGTAAVVRAPAPEETALSPRTVHTRVQAGQKYFWLDVREPEEVALASLGGHLIPLRQLPSRLSEVPADLPVLIYCHHGVRSLHALQFLQQAGFSNCVHLSGGIDAWSVQIDPAVKRY